MAGAGFGAAVFAGLVAFANTGAVTTSAGWSSCKLFVVADSRGDLIAGSVVWVTMPADKDAAHFGKLEDGYGTGDLLPPL
jgi:hypothetical protein